MTNQTNQKKGKSSKPNQQNGSTMSRALVLRARPSAPLVASRQAPRNRPAARATSGKLALPQFTIAQIDPFCPEAFGAKVPDDATAPSSVAFSRDFYSISTAASGGAGFVFRYHPGSASQTLTPVTSGSWTPGAVLGVGNGLALSANFNGTRTVAYGVKLTTRQSAFSAAGFVHVALIPDNRSSTAPGFPSTLAAMEYAPYYKRVPLADLIEDEILICGKYTDHTAFRYTSLQDGDTVAASYSNGFPTPGWMQIMVWVEGPASITNALDAEVIHHYEAFSSSLSSSGGVLAITKAAPVSPNILAATAYVTDCTEPIAVNREDEDNNGRFWVNATKLFGVGLKIASGVLPILRPVSSIYDQIIK